MERIQKKQLRLPMLLAVVGGSSVVASLFSPARDHGVIDVVSIAAATGSYAYLVTSIALARPPKGIKRFLLLIRVNKNPSERFAKLVAPLTVTVFLSATVQFLTAAKLLVNLTSPHGVYLIVVAGLGINLTYWQRASRAVTLQHPVVRLAGPQLPNP